jgi:hypothetical protein
MYRQITAVLTLAPLNHSSCPLLSNMRHLLHIQLFAILCALVAVSARPQWRLKPNDGQGNSTAGHLIDPPSSPRLRQTTRQEIRAREVARDSPNYKRQMASAVPIPSYPTCGNTGTISVAFPAGVEIVGGDVSPFELPRDDLLTCVHNSRQSDRGQWPLEPKKPVCKYATLLASKPGAYRSRYQ